MKKGRENGCVREMETTTPGKTPAGLGLETGLEPIWIFLGKEKSGSLEVWS